MKTLLINPFSQMAKKIARKKERKLWFKAVVTQGNKMKAREEYYLNLLDERAKRLSQEADQEREKINQEILKEVQERRAKNV